MNKDITYFGIDISKDVFDVMDFNLTHYIARKTFASTILHFNDVHMETVSKFLGRSSMKITQDSYGKIVEKKISLEMKRLKGNKS